MTKWGMNGARYFQRKEEYAPRKANRDSPFEKFNVQCLHCQSYKLTVKAEFNEGEGELRIFLVCPSCKASEKIAVK